MRCARFRGSYPEKPAPGLLIFKSQNRPDTGYGLEGLGGGLSLRYRFTIQEAPDRYGNFRAIGAWPAAR